MYDDFIAEIFKKVVETKQGRVSVLHAQAQEQIWEMCSLTEFYLFQHVLLPASPPNQRHRIQTSPRIIIEQFWPSTIRGTQHD